MLMVPVPSLICRGGVDQAGDEHGAGGDVLGAVGGVLADIAFDEAELVGEDESLAVLAQRLPPVLVLRVDRHREEAELHGVSGSGAPAPFDRGF